MVAGALGDGGPESAELLQLSAQLEKTSFRTGEGFGGGISGGIFLSEIDKPPKVISPVELCLQNGCAPETTLST